LESKVLCSIATTTMFDPDRLNNATVAVEIKPAERPGGINLFYPQSLHVLKLETTSRPWEL
jgi:hypothetical protein